MVYFSQRFEKQASFWTLAQPDIYFWSPI